MKYSGSFLTTERPRNSMLAGEYTHVGAGICRLGSGYYTVLLFAGGKGSGTAEPGLAGAMNELEKSLQEFEEALPAARRSVLGTKESRENRKPGTVTAPEMKNGVLKGRLHTVKVRKEK